MNTGILLVNTGTPDAPTKTAVARFLREFLMDGHVMDVPAPIRWLLVNGIIAPLRSEKSARMYQTIWTPEGSPLLCAGEALCQELARVMPAHPVVLGMRYGRPSLATALANLEKQGCTSVVMVPLFPQECDATRGSVREQALKLVRKRFRGLRLYRLPAYYGQPPYLDAIALVARTHLRGAAFDHVVFSYHGLPQRHRSVSPDYEHQCHETTRLLLPRLKLDSAKTTTSFQSRFGPGKWLEPDTAAMLDTLHDQNVAVICPGFAADCIETIHELGHRNDIHLIPCLNAHPAWVDALCIMLKDYIAESGLK